MTTHYHYNAAQRIYVRYYYDRSIRSWCWYAVTAPNDEAFQIGEANYDHEKPSKASLDVCAEMSAE
jgi:hypothetical protein